MSDLPNWLVVAGILVLALGMYVLAWRIVEGAHIVVRAATRILLGALIVVPAILYFVFGPGGVLKQEQMAEKAAPSPQIEKPVVEEKKVAEKDDAARKKEERERARKEATRQAVGDKGILEKLGIPAPQQEAGKTDAAQDDQVLESVKPADRSEPAETSPPSETAAAPEPEAPVETAEAPSEDAPAAANGSSEETAKGGFKPKFKRKAAPRYYKRSTGHGYSYRSNEGTSGSSSAGDASRGPASVDAEQPTAGAEPPPAADGMEETAAAPKMAAPEVSAAEEAAPPEAPTSMPDVAALEAPKPGLENLESLPIPSPPPGAPAAPASTPPSPPADDAPGAAPPAAAAAEEEKQEDWSVVPVFYGTDRKRTDTPERVTYDWHRGRKLELGRALVTIPKQHQVPMVERPWALEIPYLEIKLYEEAEDPKKHFTLKEIKALTKEEFLKLVRERLAASARFKDHALIFVHGYKTKFDNALFRTAQIAYDLKFDGAAFLYSWPSGGTLQGYTYDRESAAQSEPYLRKFLQMVRDETGAKKLSIIAHSMGNQPLLRVLQDLKHSLPEGVLISQLILAAPDVDRDNFENIVSSIRGIAEGITLYAASNDTALQVSRQVNGGVPRAGDVPEGGPVVIKGIDTIDATATSMDSVGINHSGYAENNALLEDIGKLIGTGVRPPEVRLPKLERVETDKGSYWRYPAPGSH